MYRVQIDTRSMNITRAQRIADGIDGSKPFYNRVEMIESIAALCARYRDEVDRVVSSANKPVYKVLWLAA